MQGVVNGRDFLLHLRRLRDDPDFDPSYSQLYDLRNVIDIPISSNEMTTIAIYRVFDKESRSAVVAEADFSFGMSRMYEALSGAEPNKLKVFRDMAEARRWLGLD
jgi:hypothetical protein